MPFTGPGFYIITSNADRGLLSYVPETRILTVQGVTGTVFQIEQMGEGVFSIQSHDARKPQFAHIVPTPGIPIPFVIVNSDSPFPWRIAQSDDGEEDAKQYALSAAEGTYAGRVWTAKLLNGPIPLIVTDRDTEVPQQRFTFDRVEV